MGHGCLAETPKAHFRAGRFDIRNSCLLSDWGAQCALDLPPGNAGVRLSRIYQVASGDFQTASIRGFSLRARSRFRVRSVAVPRLAARKNQRRRTSRPFETRRATKPCRNASCALAARLLWALTINGGLLAVEGIVQRLANCPRLLFVVLPNVHQTADTQFGTVCVSIKCGAVFQQLLWLKTVQASVSGDACKASRPRERIKKRGNICRWFVRRSWRRARSFPPRAAAR